MSLRARLVVFVAVLIIASLSVQSVLGYVSFRRLLYTDLDHDLSGYLEQMKSEVEALPGPVSGETLTFSDIDARFADYLTSARIVHAGRIKQTQGDFPEGAPLAFGPIRAFGSWRVGSVRLARDLYLQGAIASRAPEYSLSNYRQTIALTIVVVSALGVAAAFVVSRPVLRPLKHLSATAHGIARSGDLTLRVPVVGRGELTDLSRTFNVMLARLDGFLKREVRFTRNAAHELRTPLAAMRLELDAYREGYDTPQEALAVVAEEVERVTRLVDALLVLAREGRAVKTSFDLARLTREAAARAEARYRGPNRLMFEGDPLLLQRACDNLLENAHKHGKGKFITVELSMKHQDAASFITIQVADGGPGMPTETLQRAAEPFYRAPGTDAPGSGLGLSVVTQVAEAHGGVLSLSKNVPQGLRVTLKIPSHRNEKGQA